MPGGGRKTRGSYTSGGGRPKFGGAFGDSSVRTVARTTEGNDPVTGESVMKDWEFEVVFVVVLDKKPQADD